MPKRTVEIVLLGTDKVSGALGKIQGSLTKIGAGVAATGGAITAATVGIGALAMQAAPVEAIREAFDNLAESSGKSADAVLAALKEGSAGMVSQRDLMETYNLAAQLVGDTFANQLPNAMGYLGKVSAATGQDMGFMLDSLVRGVGRLSPLILDNLGIQVDLNEAYEAWADTMGVAVAEMSKADQQAALMASVMEKLAENTAAMPEVAGSAAQAVGAMKAQLADAKDTIGLAFLPVLQELIPIFRDMVDRLLPPIIALIQRFVDWFRELSPVMQMAVVAIGPLLTVLGGLMMALAPLIPTITAVVGAIISIGTPVGWTIGIIAGLAAAAGLLATAWANNWGGIRDIVQSVWDGIIKPILDALGAALNWLASVIVPLVQTAFEMAWSFIQEVIAVAWAAIQPRLEELQAVLAQFWLEMQPRLQEAWAAIQVAMQVVSDWVQGTLMPILQELWDRLEPVREIVVKVTAAFASFMASAFISSLKVWLNVIIGLWDALTAAINATVTAIQWVIEWLELAIDKWNEFRQISGARGAATAGPGGGIPPGLQAGLAYVPMTMPAILHRGEAVLSARQAQAWRRGRVREAPSYTIISNFGGVYGVDGAEEALEDALRRAARYAR